MKNVYSKLIFGRAKLNCCISHIYLPQFAILDWQFKGISFSDSPTLLKNQGLAIQYAGWKKKFPPGKIASFIDFVWNNNWFSHNFFSNFLLLWKIGLSHKTNNFKWFDIIFFLSAKTSTKFTKTKTGHTYDNPSHQGLRGQFCSLKNDLSSWSRQMWSSHGFPHF